MRRAAGLPILIVLAIAVSALAGATSSARALAPAADVTSASVSAGPFQANVDWTISAPSQVIVEYGVDERYGVWSKTAISSAAGTGRSVLVGLEPGTDYRYRVRAKSGQGLGIPSREGTFRTPPVPTSARASIQAVTSAVAQARFTRTPTPTSASSVAMHLDGSPFFPRTVYRQCPWAFDRSLAAGINLFMGTYCTTTTGHLGLLSGRAFSALDAHIAGTSGPGIVGWHYADEADVSVGHSDGLPTVNDPNRVTFLTLTDHFSPRKAPPPKGKGIYPAMIARADVVGFDSYPLEERCRPDTIGQVYDLQRDLVKMAPGKVTFQWIEAGPMEKCFRYDPTPAIVRAEAWLAVAGGARGIGYFPDVWPDDIQRAVTELNREFVALSAALTGPEATVKVSTKSPVRAGGRTHMGATYVIAVNPTFNAQNVRISVPGLAGRSVRVFGGEAATSSGDVITDTLEGLEARIYIVPPPGW